MPAEGLTRRTHDDLARFSERELETIQRFITASKNGATAEIRAVRDGTAAP